MSESSSRRLELLWLEGITEYESPAEQLDETGNEEDDDDEDDVEGDMEEKDGKGESLLMAEVVETRRADDATVAA